MKAGLEDEESPNSVAACHLSAWLQMDFLYCVVLSFYKIREAPSSRNSVTTS
jgi:hypothetical protein